MRAELLAQSPFNVVEIDLPESTRTAATATSTPRRCSRSGAPSGTLVQEREPALLGAEQDYTAPDGRELTRAAASSRACASRTTARAASGPTSAPIPGPKEDRLRLTRATRANLSPIFSLFPDPDGAAPERARAGTAGEPFATATDARRHGEHALARRRRRRDRGARRRRSTTAELLIADGHHRYETARVYAEEIGGEGEHSLRADVPLLAHGPGPDCVPHPPPAHRPEGRQRSRRRSATRSSATSTSSRSSARSSSRRRRGRARAVGLHGLASTSSPTG